MSPSVSITRGVMGGQPCLDGTRIDIAGVVAVWRHYGMARTVETWDGVTEEDIVHAVWVWFWFFDRRHANTKIMRWAKSYRQAGKSAGDPPKPPKRPLGATKP